MDAEQLTAFKAKVKRYTEAKTATREIARRTLIDQGIYTEDGKIAPEYGGENGRTRPSSASDDPSRHLLRTRISWLR